MTLQDIKNQEHDRAKYAYDCVTVVTKDDSAVNKKKYRSAVLSAGVLVRIAGLLQALSFYLSKPNNYGYGRLAEHILRWEDMEIPSNKNEPLEAYHELLQLEDAELMMRTTKTLALITWLKRFSEAMLSEDKQDDKTSE